MLNMMGQNLRKNRLLIFFGSLTIFRYSRSYIPTFFPLICNNSPLVRCKQIRLWRHIETPYHTDVDSAQTSPSESVLLVKYEFSPAKNYLIYASISEAPKEAPIHWQTFLFREYRLPWSWTPSNEWTFFNWSKI